MVVLAARFLVFRKTAVLDSAKYFFKRLGWLVWRWAAVSGKCSISNNFGFFSGDQLPNHDTCFAYPEMRDRVTHPRLAAGSLLPVGTLGIMKFLLLFFLCCMP